MPEEASPLDAVIGANIRALRTAKKISQEELARRVTDIVGTTFRQQTVLRTEQGSRPLRFAEAAAIAEVLGVPAQALATRAPVSDDVAKHQTEILKCVVALWEEHRQIAGALERFDNVMMRLAADVGAVPAELRDRVLSPEQNAAIDALMAEGCSWMAMTGAIDAVGKDVATLTDAFGSGLASLFPQGSDA